MRRVVVWLSAILLFPSTSEAWSNMGHEVTCAIAYRLLSDEERAEVDRLTGLYRRPDGRRYKYFTQGCTFADLARERAEGGLAGWRRFARFDRWHFFNVSRETVELDPAACARDCVLHAISHHGARLSDPGLDDRMRAEALLLLGHWVGDIHQPLHVSYADDRGGGLIPLIQGGFYETDNLHSLWDRGILEKIPMKEGWWAYAGKLRDAIPADAAAEWGDSEPVTWAQESYNLTVAEDLLYCRRPVDGSTCGRIGQARDVGRSYQRRFAPTVELRLQKAGARLAALIRRALAKR